MKYVPTYCISAQDLRFIVLLFTVAFRFLSTVLLLVDLTVCLRLVFIIPFGGYPIITSCRGDAGAVASVDDGAGAGGGVVIAPIRLLVSHFLFFLIVGLLA